MLHHVAVLVCMSRFDKGSPGGAVGAALSPPGFAGSELPRESCHLRQHRLVPLVSSRASGFGVWYKFADVFVDGEVLDARRDLAQDRIAGSNGSSRRLIAMTHERTT